jgi:glucose-1-phosphate thymidylyltransferase
MPKQLVPVANRPVLLHCLDRIREAGVREVAIIVSTERGQAIRNAVGDGSQHGLSVTYLPQEAPLGLAHCVQLARDVLGDEDFLMYLGDNILVPGVADLADRFRATRPAAQVVVTRVDNPAEFGVACVGPDGRVTRLVEKPKEPVSDLALIGAYFFTPAIHEAVRAIKPSARGELEITDAIQWLVTDGQLVTAAEYNGYWRDTGRIEDLLDCNRALLDAIKPSVDGEVDELSRVIGPVSIAEGARVIRSTIIGPAAIGPHSLIVDSTVGPYSALGGSCVLVGAGIENSIVLDRVNVRHVRSIQGSLIGRSAEVILSDRELTKHRLIIGDDTKVEMVA